MGNVADKEMQLPDGFAKQPKFALENLMFVLQRRAKKSAARPRSAGEGWGI